MNKIKQILKSKYTQKILKTLPYIAISILVGVTAVYAGAINKLVPPGSVSNTMYSLTDIYNLAQGTTTDEGTGEIEATPAVGNTGHTLTEVYTTLSTEIAKLTPSVLVSGNTIFGVEGEATTGSTVSSSPLKTGQTHCNQFADDYNEANQVPCTDTNQDGESQRGVARSYTDNSNGTITDNSTNLIWQKCSDGQTETDCSGGSAVAELFDDGNGVSPAINYCENLSLAGYTDWHLPNVNELQSLADYGKVNPSIDTTYFPNTQSAYYWSSTAYQNYANGAWIVNFGDGNVYIGSMDNNYFVRCVRENNPV